MFGYVYRRVGHRQTAEDLCSDVFLRALHRIGTFRWQGAEFGAWLMTIARNRVHDHFKSAPFRLEATCDAVFDGAERDRAADPEAAAISSEAGRRVHAALRALSGDQARVLYLRYIRHLSVAEVAAVMGRSAGAVKALQYRALRSLARKLQVTSGTRP